MQALHNAFQDPTFWRMTAVVMVGFMAWAVLMYALTKMSNNERSR